MDKIWQLIEKNLAKFKFSPPPILSPSKIKTELPVITISREMGAGGHPIAELVVKKLGPPWKLYHEELVDKIAKSARLQKELILEVDERKRPMIEELVYDILGKRYLSLSKYYRYLVKTLAAIGKRGYAVIVGRGANFILKDALKIRVICDMEQRIKWEIEFEKISREEAIRRIEQSDKKRYEFVKTLFNHDIRKAHHYDLVIKTSKDLSIYDAAEAIVMIAKRRFRL